jgi:hypothetical protein
MPPLPAAAPKKGLIERVALITLVGLSVVSVLGVALVTVYLNRINDSTSALARTDAMPAYVGRPQPVAAANGSAPMNFLVLVTTSDSLDAVVVANLSASRRSLTLITVPANLAVPATPSQTLASSYALDPAITVRAMEGLTGARMDHQIRLDLTCFAAAIDTVGGVDLAGTHLNGNQAVQKTRLGSDSSNTALATGSLIRAALIGANDHFGLLDPSRFPKMIDTINPCLQVDTGLTAEVIQSTLVESSVHPQDTRLWPLAARSSTTGLTADASASQALREALASPDLVTTAQYQQATLLP